MLTLSCILSLCQFVYAEYFRVNKTITAEITEQTTAINVELGINDVLYLSLPEEALFLQGIEMNIKIPHEVAAYKDAIAYSLYTDIQPIPDETTIDYAGNKVYIDTFPARLSSNIKIPLQEDHSIESNPYTVMLPFALREPVKDIFFRIQLVMKGTSQELLDAVFQIEVSPVFTDEGSFDLTVLYPPEFQENHGENSYIVFIDEKPIEFTKAPIILKTGTHHVTIASEKFRSEVRTVTIEQAKTAYLKIQLKDITPLLAVSAPENTRLFINNTEYTDFSKPISMEQGQHQLRLSLGDYEVVRTLEVINGRTYTISLSFDIEINEE